jgi:hypothetical protein
LDSAHAASSKRPPSCACFTTMAAGSKRAP